MKSITHRLTKLVDAKWFGMIVVTVIMLLPLEVCLAAWWVLGPEGFWQKLAMAALSLVFFVFQIIFLGFGVPILISIKNE